MTDNEDDFTEKETEEKINQFHEFGLDDRILKAIAKLGWFKPTLIQEKSIPLILSGKDLLLRARTGSGKTGAFTIPLIHKILSSKKTKQYQKTTCLILAPSKELCHQIYQVFICLTAKCSREIKCIDISFQNDVTVQKSLLAENPDVVISTPGKVLQHIKAKNLNIKRCLETLVIDEADLIFSFGYKDDIKHLLSYLPTIYQAILASATLSNEVLFLKRLVLQNPAILKLKEPPLAPPNQLSHYTLAAEENDKATILYSLLKLRLIRGKSIIFVNAVDRCYKLKLFLEQFGIPTCVLNSELPATSRCRAVTHFNNGTFDIIIAADEKALDEPHTMIQKRKRKKDIESGVERGIDFQFVSNVLNFDFPIDVNSYIHRVGRTARGKNQGTALSFVALKEMPFLDEVVEHLKKQYEEKNLFRTYQFKLNEVEGFRYRAKDAWKAVTRIAVREARLKEIKQEVLACDKLKSYFEDNPRDLQSLRQDKALHTVKLQSHLKNVPEYIVPLNLKCLAVINKRKRKFNRQLVVNGATAAKSKYQSQAVNPLIAVSLGKKKN